MAIKIFDLIGYGSVSVDDLLIVEHYPEPDTKIHVLHRERQGGGLTGSALVSAARLGAKTAFFGALGLDDLSIFTMEEFSREDIDCSLVIRREDAHPIHSTIIVDQSTGERTIFLSMEGFDPLSPQEIPYNLISKTRFLLLDSCVMEKFPSLISIAEQLAVPIMADIESEHMLVNADELSSINYLFLNFKTAKETTGSEDPKTILEKLHSPSRLCTVVTCGKEGCWYKTVQPGIYQFPAYKVDVVDTTGCGDVFHGAFAAALIQHKSVDEAVRWGSAAAALKAKQPGGRKGIPDLSTLIDFIDSHPQNKAKAINL
jgi:sugar/nucleoside kinase (ribokinase family)